MLVLGLVLVEPQQEPVEVLVLEQGSQPVLAQVLELVC